ncbi:helix-turn-helix domain-containing protein [uncultured Allofournierella sp.]|uniref:helix-turn-helix transcriptional regulator n=1 Tax=uncultured Allofournierella sp. TaxID=1940258 RepID=UPI003750739E
MQPYFTPYADQNITQEVASLRLPLDKVITGWYSNRRVFQSVVHSHPYHEYILMESGHAMYHVDGSRYELRPGELMIIPPGTVHSGQYDNYDRLILQIDDAFWRQTLHGSNLPDPESCVPQQLMIFGADCVQKWGIRSLIERAAVSASILDLSAREIMYRCLLVELALSIGQMILESGLRPPTATSPLAVFATTYLQEHFRDPELTASELARRAYVSREHLSRVFREYTLQGVHQYLTDLRMQHCRRDLAAGKPVLAACLENGFSNYSSFVKSFRKMYGITPQEYRNQLRSALRSEPVVDAASS